jgi:hypothetical protein
MSDEQVRRALRALAESDRDLAAPPQVEARLQAAFRKRRTTLKWRRAAIWTVAAAAMLAGVAVLREWRPRPNAPALSGLASPAPTRQPQQQVPQQVLSSQVQSRVPVRQVRNARLAPPREIATEFFPLVDYPPPFERGELVRVTVPAAAMRAVGLPVREDRLTDRVQADVLIGQEGMARAIRFVGYSR